MPQKLNKAGKMQDYIPKGNGDASGEYGTSNGTNKNFTTSDKKSKANVITENKSVVVGNKEKEIKKQQERYLNPDEYKKVVEKAKSVNKKTDDVVDEIYDLQDKYGYDVDTALSKIKENKANIIDDDLTPSGIINKGVDKAMDEFFEKNLMREDFITANKKDWLSEDNKGSNQYQIREILLKNDKTGLKDFWQVDAQDTKWKVKNAIENKYNAKLKEYATKKINQLKALNRTQNGIDKERTKKGIKELEDLIKDI